VNSNCPTSTGCSQRQSCIFAAVSPAPHLPLLASGRFANGHCLVSSGFGGKLAFHGQSHEKLLAHQPQADFLHGSDIGEELHVHRSPLANAPGSSAGLPQSVQGVAGLMEQDGRKFQLVEASLDQLGMADGDVDAALQLLAVPRLPVCA